MGKKLVVKGEDLKGYDYYKYNHRKRQLKKSCIVEDDKMIL